MTEHQPEPADTASGEPLDSWVVSSEASQPWAGPEASVTEPHEFVGLSETQSGPGVSEPGPEATEPQPGVSEPAPEATEPQPGVSEPAPEATAPASTPAPSATASTSEPAPPPAFPSFEPPAPPSPEAGGETAGPTPAARAATLAAEHPELVIAAAFVGGFLLATILKRLAK